MTVRAAVVERGLSVSVLVCLLVPVLLLCAGLAVDGAGQAAANRRAEAVAAQAARAGMDAAAPLSLAGRDGGPTAVAAAQSVLTAHPEIVGEVTFSSNGSLQVDTTTSVPSVFLGLVGIDRLPGRGSAAVELRPR